MLNSENNRFPNSASLFLLCKEILNIKHARGEKVTDQDVGSLLDFDPADCTHWKYGRKSIKSIQSLQLIADKLGLDSRSVADVAQGRTTLLDTVWDFKGYGPFDCEESVRSRLLEEAEFIVKKINTHSLPVFLPELLTVIPGIVLKQQEALEDFIEESYENDTYVLSWQKKVKLCASLRFLLMQKISKHYLSLNSDRLQLPKIPTAEQCNLFSLFLLMPTYLLQLASCQRDPAKDVVDQFSQFFWLTRSLVNIRLKDFFQHKN